MMGHPTLDSRKFQLTAPAVPRFFIAANLGADLTPTQRAALADAMRGDFSALDALELAAINVRVRLGEYAIIYQDGRLHPWFDPNTEAFERIGSDNEPTAIALLRGAGAGGRMLIAWMVLHYCPGCWGRRRTCRECGGLGYVEPDDRSPEVLTTSEGVVVEDHVEA